MSNINQSRDSMKNELKIKQICRFCLTQQMDKLGSIYARDVRLKASAQLPVQVMACASIEVFSNDGMPSWVCTHCRLLFEHAYRFKQMCKRAENLLRQFPLTGQWPDPLAKPKIPEDLPPTVVQQRPKQIATPHTLTTSSAFEPLPEALASPPKIIKKPANLSLPKKILNADPADSPEPPAPMRMKKEIIDSETTMFLNKVENNEELSMDDVQRLIAATEDEREFEYLHDSAASTPSTPKQHALPAKRKPKLLNKSSIRILNKDAEVVHEPRLSVPQVKRDEEGNVAIVTEILDPLMPYDVENEIAETPQIVVPEEAVVFPCPHCERSFPLRQLRDIHMVNHTRNRSFQCPECDKSFFSKYDLLKHNLIHTGDRPYKCTICEKAFTRATLLHRHEKTHTDVPKFICVFCEKTFISKEQMEKHSERHLKNRPYQCKVCSKSFAFKQGLERHEVIHSREQPYPCQYCEQSFSTTSKLARHLTAHAGKRPYPCKFCPKSYLLSHHLTRHMRSHKNGSMVFMCGQCEKVYKTRDELIYHSAVHATQTLVCPLCKEIFQDIESVTVHIKEHAEGEAYACEFCDFIFMTAERLQKHTDTDHADDMVAYHEDDQARPQQNTAENLKILEETIEEFLVDELPYDAQVLSDEKLVEPQIIKEEMDWTTQNESPQILNQIVYKTNISASDEENLLLLDDQNIIVGRDNLDAAVAPPAKLRKVVVSSANSNQIIKVMERKSNSERTVIPPTRRKVATAPPQLSQKIKTEEDGLNASTTTSKIEKQPSLNTVLKMLPKGVSVRRNTSLATKEQTSTNTSSNSYTDKQNKLPQTTAQSGIKKFPVSKSPNSNVAVATQQKTSTVVSMTVSKTTQQQTNTPQRSSAAKAMKMMLGEKKVRVQKITITKAEAAAMAKDGRIRMKDGAMILTKAIK